MNKELYPQVTLCQLQNYKRKAVEASTSNTSIHTSTNIRPEMEDYRPGYPQYTALLSSHPAFQNVRRFTRIRMRLLLLKQDEITMLEESLDRIDSQEDRPLFLGCARRDTNASRKDIIEKLTKAIDEYGT